MFWESGNSCRWPDDHILAFCKVQKRFGGRKDDSRRLGHAIFRDFGFGGLQWPRRMLDFSANQAPVRIGRVQAIAFGQKIFQGSGHGVARSADWTISCM